MRFSGEQADKQDAHIKADAESDQGQDTGFEIRADEPWMEG